MIELRSTKMSKVLILPEKSPQSLSPSHRNDFGMHLLCDLAVGEQ
jgi:hypothetical protein